MPALGSPIVRQARRLAAAYRGFPGPSTTQPSEVLGARMARRAAPDGTCAGDHH